MRGDSLTPPLRRRRLWMAPYAIRTSESMTYFQWIEMFKFCRLFWLQSSKQFANWSTKLPDLRNLFFLQYGIFEYVLANLVSKTYAALSLSHSLKAWKQRVFCISFYQNQWEYVIFDTKSIQFPKKKVKNTDYIMKLIHKNIEKGLGGSIGLIPVSVY